jgi:hypothetical protein
VNAVNHRYFTNGTDRGILLTGSHTSSRRSARASNEFRLRATAIWLGHRSRLQYAVAHLSMREADFLLAGATLICGCFFTGDTALYRGIYLLFALPGLLTLAHRLPLQLARAAFRGTCVAIVFVV